MCFMVIDSIISEIEAENRSLNYLRDIVEMFRFDLGKKMKNNNKNSEKNLATDFLLLNKS